MLNDLLRVLGRYQLRQNENLHFSHSESMLSGSHLVVLGIGPTVLLWATSAFPV
jgi:hypothetical protein